MDKQKLEKELQLLKKDLSRCNNRCNKISKACGLESNTLIEYAMQQTEDILQYIQSLKEGSKAADKQNDNL